MTTSLIESELAAAGVAQVIVVLSGPAAAAAGTAAAASAAPGITAYFRSSELSLNNQIAASGTRHAGARLAVASATRRAVNPPPPVRYYPNLGIMLGTVDRAGLAALEADAGVDTVSGAPPLSPIWPERVAAAKAPKDLTWGLKALRVDQLWAQNITGAGVRVAQLDTGIDGTHSTLLNGGIHKFAEFDLFGTKRTPAPAAHDTDPDGHGTHTAATIVGRRVGNRHVGVAPGAQLLGAIVIEGGNAIARVLGGIDWALGEGMRVLSLSLGFRGWWDDFVPIMSVLRARNVLPVIAVGNEGAGNSRSPGNYPNVISVGAMDKNGGIPNFSGSQRFTRVDRPEVPYLVAPGVDVISAMPGGGYQSMDGSSMATPHVAGLAALLFEARPAATVLEVEAAILGSCTVRPGMDPARAGAGCPDAVRALEILTGASAITPAKPAPGKKTRKRSTTKNRATPKKRKTTGKKAPAKKVAAKRGRSSRGRR